MNRRAAQRGQRDSCSPRRIIRVGNDHHRRRKPATSTRVKHIDRAVVNRLRSNSLHLLLAFTSISCERADGGTTFDAQRFESTYKHWRIEIVFEQHWPMPRLAPLGDFIEVRRAIGHEHDFVDHVPTALECRGAHAQRHWPRNLLSRGRCRLRHSLLRRTVSADRHVRCEEHTHKVRAPTHREPTASVKHR